MTRRDQLTPRDRAAISRLGGLARSAHEDPREYTRAARQAFRDRFLTEVDPDGSLRLTDPAEATRRAEAARRAFYVRIALDRERAKRARTRQQEPTE